MALKTDGVRLDELTADPGTPENGDVWLNSTDGVVRARIGGNSRTVEDKLNKFDATVDPVVGNDNTQGYRIGSKWINTTSGEFFWCADASTGAAVWEKAVADAGEPSASYRRDINPGVLVTTGNASKVVTNDYGAIELPNSSTTSGVWSNRWRRTPVTSVKVKCQFKLKVAGTGTIVRMMVRYKAKAVGESTAGAFDQEIVKAVTVNPAAPDNVYEGVVDLAIANFTEGDAVAMHIGRDGNNEIVSGEASDDFNKRVQLLAIELEII